MEKTVTVEELTRILKSLDKNQKFGIKFIKKNGEVREYGECTKTVQYERSVNREGLTAAEHRERGNFLFYSHDCKGFRITGFDKIKAVVIGEDVYNVGVVGDGQSQLQNVMVMGMPMQMVMTKGLKMDFVPLDGSKIVPNDIAVAEDKLKMVKAVLDAIGGVYTVIVQTPYLVIKLAPKPSYNGQLFKYNIYTGEFLAEKLD